MQNGVEIEQLDVNDAASIRTAVASTLSQTGNKLDAVVHNAGVAAAGALEDVPESELRRVMETNFFGMPKVSRVTCAEMITAINTVVGSHRSPVDSNAMKTIVNGPPITDAESAAMPTVA